MTAAINLAPARRLSRDTLRLERILPGSPERVWAYLTEADKRAQWFSGGTTMTEKGQVATLHFQHSDFADEPTPEKYKEMDKGGFKSDVTVLTYDPPRELAYTWPEGDNISEVTFELSPEGGDTRLVLTHRRIGTTDYMVSFASGWHSHFDALGQVLDGKKPKGFWTNVLRLERDYAAALSSDGY